MSGFWHVVVSLGVGSAALAVLRGQRSFRETTLKSAWIWSLVTAAVWTLTWFVDQCETAMSEAVADHAWYACAVLALCPPIAVLGSRRPGTRVWTPFILFPMLLALGWPVIALWMQGTELRGLQLETPQLVAFGLVLVMGVGNYCGTRFTLSALLYGGATLALVVSSSAVSPGWLTDRSGTRFWSTTLMVIAVGLMKTSLRPIAATRFDRLWFDFFDLFGIVWGRRIQDRVNFIANKEGWPSRLELDGFVSLAESRSTDATVPQFSELDRDPRRDTEKPNGKLAEMEPRMEQTFRWLLRRFVDPVWIDQRLGPNSDPNVSPLAADS